MNELELMGRLASAAKSPPPPTVNVVGPVMTRIEELWRPPLTMWWLAAGLSTAAGIIVAIAVLQTWLSVQEPLSSWAAFPDMVLR